MASTIIASVITGGSNSHSTVAEELNAYATDFVTQGVVGAITAGPPQTGSFGLTQDASPDMGVTVLAGQAYVSGTPSGQDAQVLRARMTANYTSYTISSNSTGTTKYDWIYLQLNAANASNPDSAADNVINLYTSRSSSNSSDNGSPPTFGLLLGVVTVANGASSIVNANISDQRINTSIGAQGGSLIVTPETVGQDAIIQAAGAATNINLDLNPKGSGEVKITGLYNPYKFSVYKAANQTVTDNTWTKINLDTKVFDTSSNFDNTTNYQFTAPISGFYWLGGAVATSGLSDTAAFQMGINIGTFSSSPTYTGGTQYVGAGTAAPVISTSVLVSMTANQTAQLYAWSNSTTIVGGAAFLNMQGFLVSAF